MRRRTSPGHPCRRPRARPRPVPRHGGRGGPPAGPPCSARGGPRPRRRPARPARSARSAPSATDPAVGPERRRLRSQGPRQLVGGSVKLDRRPADRDHRAQCAVREPPRRPRPSPPGSRGVARPPSRCRRSSEQHQVRARPPQPLEPGLAVDRAGHLRSRRTRRDRSSRCRQPARPRSPGGSAAHRGRGRAPSPPCRSTTGSSPHRMSRAGRRPRGCPSSRAR